MGALGHLTMASQVTWSRLSRGREGVWAERGPFPGQKSVHAKPQNNFSPRCSPKNTVWHKAPPAFSPGRLFLFRLILHRVGGIIVRCHNCYHSIFPPEDEAMVPNCLLNQLESEWSQAPSRPSDPSLISSLTRPWIFSPLQSRRLAGPESLQVSLPPSPREGGLPAYAFDRIAKVSVCMSVCVWGGGCTRVCMHNVNYDSEVIYHGEACWVELIWSHTSGFEPDRHLRMM